MKKLIALLLATLMLLSLAACGGGSEEDPKTTSGADTPPQSSAAPSEDQDPAADLPSYNFTQYGNAKITIVGAEFTKNDWDEDVLRVYFDYTNTDDSARGHYIATALDFISVTQDGNDCEKYSFSVMDEMTVPEDLNRDLYVQPGCTSRNTMCFRCDPNGGVVKVSCYLMIGSWMYNPDDIEPFEFEIDPKNLMGAPEPFVLDPITNPTYTSGMSASGPFDYPLDSEISIDGIELTKDCDGNDVLRVKLTVTNNDEEALTPGLMCCMELYQDGVSLPWVSIWDMDEATAEDEAYETDLYPGERVVCSALFYPRNENPVEAVIESTNSDLRLGVRFDVKALFDKARADASAAADAAAAAAAAASAADKAIMKQLVGVWDRTNSWADHLTFNADNTGIHDMTGDEFPMTYYVKDGVLVLLYDDGDEISYTVTINGDDLLLVDTAYGDAQTFVRAGTEEPEDTEPTTEATEPVITLADELIGVWVSEEDGETYAFNKDGTGYQIYEGVTYTYTYKLDGDYLEIFYDVGGEDGVTISIDGDTLTIAYNWTYTRQ